MSGRDKVLAEHRERCAFVYARQSSPAQVIHHRTSTERQFDLVERAAQLGWPATQIELVAEDLGRSGKFSENREGFQRLAAAVSPGRVGAVFILEASRLARSSADWHRLLDIACLTRTLIIDESTVYDPRDPNDRLVLGMKGTMADFELVWLRQRMDGGRWYLARKGELRHRVTVGYVYDGNRRVFDPDEEVQRAVALLFERFAQASSCRDLVRDFGAHNLRFPSRHGERIVWKPLTAGRARFILRNPIYAGAFVYGRHRSETILEHGERRQRNVERPMSDWPVILRDAHPAYISWEQFMANQARLEDGRPARSSVRRHGAARDGAGLLQGMLLCGRCSGRLEISYRGNNGRYVSYACRPLVLGQKADGCIRVSGRYIEEPVVAYVLSTLTKDNLEAATKVVEILEEEDAVLNQQWKLRIERARYEAKRAERQYDTCDPENRVVARTLETRWNEKLAELERLEREHEELKQRRRLELNDLDRQRILDLADDLPKLWHSDKTTDRDRKVLLRLLLQEVGVTQIDVPRRMLRLRLLWHTQAVTDIEVDLPAPHTLRKSFKWRVVETTAPLALGATP
jgi:DNA invertase Pin-like site-specific DNA recombinase